MATIETVQHLDDVEHSKGRKVRADVVDLPFGLDGRSYRIDLSEKNHAELRELLAPFIAAARRRRGGSAVSMPSQRTSSTDREQNRAIREWAAGRGITISDRGRIRDEVLAAYRAYQEAERQRPQTNGHAVRAPQAAPAPEPEPEPAVRVPEPAEEPAVASTGGKGRIARIAARVAAQAAAARPTFGSKAELNKAVREWAGANGMPLAARGKVPDDVMAQYVRVHGEPVVER